MKHLGDVATEEVLSMARLACRDKGGELDQKAEDEFRMRAPYARWLVESSEIGELYFQPEDATTQYPMRTHFPRWAAYLARADAQARRKHASLVDALLEGRSFRHLPIFRSDLFVLDGANRSLAAYDVVVNHGRALTMEIFAGRSGHPLLSRQ